MRAIDRLGGKFCLPQFNHWAGGLRAHVAGANGRKTGAEPAEDGAGHRGRPSGTDSLS